jgi:hypothetical protein
MMTTRDIARYIARRDIVRRKIPFQLHIYQGNLPRIEVKYKYN